MTDTIKYWTDKAYEALNKAAEISELTGESFRFSVEYGMGGTYYPKGGGMSKTKALELLSSGRSLSDLEKSAIRKAIEEETILDDQDSGYEFTGWTSSSSQC